MKRIHAYLLPLLLSWEYLFLCYFDIVILHRYIAGGDSGVLLVWFIIFAVVVLYNINKMTNSLCLQKEIPEDRQPKVFRTINVLITVLLLSTYVEIYFT
jgi:hypothetical protein